MKIFIQPIAPILMRVNIKKTGHKTEYITLCETTQEAVLDYITDIINQQKISPFEKGYVTNVEVRECIESKNGKAKSISFKGIDPITLKEIIIKSMDASVPLSIT